MISSGIGADFNRFGSSGWRPTSTLVSNASIASAWGPLAIAGLVTLLLQLAQNPAFSSYLRRSTLAQWLPPLLTLLGVTMIPARSIFRWQGG